MARLPAIPIDLSLIGTAAQHIANAGAAKGQGYASIGASIGQGITRQGERVEREKATAYQKEQDQYQRGRDKIGDERWEAGNALERAKAAYEILSGQVEQAELNSVMARAGAGADANDMAGSLDQDSALQNLIALRDQAGQRVLGLVGTAQQQQQPAPSVSGAPMRQGGPAARQQPNIPASDPVARLAQVKGERAMIGARRDVLQKGKGARSSLGILNLGREESPLIEEEMTLTHRIKKQEDVQTQEREVAKRDEARTYASDQDRAKKWDEKASRLSRNYQAIAATSDLPEEHRAEAKRRIWAGEKEHDVRKSYEPKKPEAPTGAAKGVILGEEDNARAEVTGAKAEKVEKAEQAVVDRYIKQKMADQAKDLPTDFSLVSKKNAEILLRQMDNLHPHDKAALTKIAGESGSDPDAARLDAEEKLIGRKLTDEEAVKFLGLGR